jgi:hypothetical protein
MLLCGPDLADTHTKLCAHTCKSVFRFPSLLYMWFTLWQ